MAKKRAKPRAAAIVVRGEILPTMVIDFSKAKPRMNTKGWTRGPAIPVRGEILPTLVIDFSKSPSGVNTGGWTHGPLLAMGGKVVPSKNSRRKRSRSNRTKR